LARAFAALELVPPALLLACGSTNGSFPLAREVSGDGSRRPRAVIS
jgi:hypothetical protein